MKEIILVTGAAGATGGQVARELLRNQARVRALVHRKDHRSEELEKLGAEVAVGDLQNLTDLRAAMGGVRTAYFVYPLSPTIVGASVAFAQAAREGELDLVVNMSQLPAASDAASPASLNHWLSEEAFNWSGVPFAHIRANFFMEWMLRVAPIVKAAGVVTMPWTPSSLCTPVATEDVARAIATMLLTPAPHVGKYHELVGPELLSWAQYAETLSKVIGKDIPYQQADLAQFVERTGMGDYFHNHVRVAVELLANGDIFQRQNNLIEEITGQRPLTPREFLERHRTAFTD